MAPSQRTPLKQRWRGYLAVFGGILIHLTLGSVYTLGNLVPYLASYIRSFVNENTTTLDLVWVMGSVGIGQGILMPVAGFVQYRFGPRVCTLIGCVVMSAGMALNAFSINSYFVFLLITHGVALGIGIAMAYVPPVSVAMQWFPERKGLVSGIVVAFMGGGTFLLTQVQTIYLNPDNLTPNKTTGFFEDDEMLNRLPSMYILLACGTATLQLIGCMLLVQPTSLLKSKDEAIKESSANDDPDSKATFLNDENTKASNVNDEWSLTSVLKIREFYIFWITYLCNSGIISYIASVYKALGQTYILDDQFLALVGSVGALFNTGSRVLWGIIYDRFGYKKSMTFLCASLSILLATWSLITPYGKVPYALWIWLLFSIYPGTFVLLLPCLSQTFGNQHVTTIYGLINSSLILSGPLISVMTQNLFSLVGWTGLGLITSGMAAISLVSTLLIRLPKN